MSEITVEELRYLRKEVVEMLYQYGSSNEHANLIDNSNKLVNYIVTGKLNKKPEVTE